MIFQGIGFLILAVFYGCYFLKMLRQRRSGIRTDQIGKGKQGRAKRIEITMKIATFSVPAAEVISILLAATAFPQPVRIAGAVLGAAGDAVFITSVVTMKDSWRAGVSENEHTDLVTNGIYRISRNPAFLGFDLVYLGIGMMFFNIPLAVLSIFAMVLFHLQIVFVEEEFLRRAYGEEYRAYTMRVNRYFGRK